ncbi:MAG: AraC family ligand binding domain-containing protein, partial [Giesbergeria sp.]|nr:AraC family ligand binding domain-containing protein [Giesbergeria sp.]
MDPAEALSLRQYGASPGSHSHGHFQILLGLSGALDLEVEGRGLRVASGSGCVIEPGARHDFESAHGSLCLVLDSGHPGWARCIAQPAAHALPLARYLASALQQGLPLAQAQGPALLREAWLPGAASAPPTHTRRRTIDWQALRLWAAGQWQHPLSVADLAERTHLSTAQFAARCREEQGLAAMAWLRSLRLEQAQWLRA